MKAKEYAEKYESIFRNCKKSEELKKEIYNLFIEFMNEINDLRIKRNIGEVRDIVELENDYTIDKEYSYIILLLSNGNLKAIKIKSVQKIREIK